MKIVSVGKAFPANYYDQETLLAALKRSWGQRYHNPARLEALHRNVLVGGRHLALPLERYDHLASWGEANDAWIEVAQQTGEIAIREALELAGMDVSDIGVFVFVTVTGLATPSIDALLMNRLGLSADVRRVPIFGLGCVGGTAGVARAADLLHGFPDKAALLLSVELCSLTLQREDLSVANLIATGLFGDGAAAAIVVGERRPERGPVVVASRSVFYPDTEEYMGWKISEKGFGIVLSADVPKVVKQHVRNDVDRFLEDHGLERSDISRWISHPGGPRVLEAMQEALELPDAALELSWRTLREIGNVSSTSVLLVLKQTLEEYPPEPGAYGLMLAMGPGFCSEFVLLRW
jgi:alkylresorcinol/alkylpyrone synthase